MTARVLAMLAVLLAACSSGPSEPSGSPVAGPTRAAVPAATPESVDPVPPKPETQPSPGATASPAPVTAPASAVPSGVPSAVVQASVVAAQSSRVQSILARLPHPSGAVYESLVGSDHAEVDATSQLASASVIKLPLMIATMRQIGAGKLQATTTHSVRRDQVVGGSGILQGQVGRTLTTTELLEVTLSYSDNTGGNMLVDALGGLPVINGTLTDLGFTDTRMQRRLMDLQAQQRGLENMTSAADVSTMLRQIWTGKLLSQDSSQEMLRILRLRGKITDPSLDFIGRHLVPRPPIAHLNGTLAGVRNEAGIVEVANNPFLLVVLLNEQRDEPAAEEAIARAAADIAALTR